MTNLYEQATARPEGFRDVQPAVAERALDGVRIIDVREPHEYNGELGHVAGAQLVPLGTLPQQLQGWNKDETYLMVCKSGGRSGQAAAFLAKQGFQRVMNLAGGMLAWNALSLPVERG